MKQSSYVFIGLVVIQSALVFGQSSRCYFCNTEVHGEACNDPIVSNDIQIQGCSDSEIVSNETSYLAKAWDVFKHYNIFAQKADVATRNTYEDVCIYMTYTFSSRQVSARGCEKELRNTNIGELDICNYYSQIYPTGRISNFNCTVCKSNLCNHANFAEESDENDSATPGGASRSTTTLSLTILMVTYFTTMFFV